MEKERPLPRQPWDFCREVPPIEDEYTSWKNLKLLKFVCLCVVALLVFALALCSKTSFLLLITFAHDGTKVLPWDQKPVALLCIGCALITPSVLLFLKSIWKACYKTSKIPNKRTVALVLFFELIVSSGTAILTVVAMPHFDIVTNVTILNSVSLVSTFLQVIAQCSAKQNNRFLVPSITALLLVVLGYILFGVLYILKDPNDTKMIIWVGLAIGASVLVSFNWWESYFRLIGENSNSDRLKNLCRDMTRCQNLLHIISSLLRIAVTAAVVGGYVPLAKMDWAVVTSIPSHETKIIGITIGVQLISSALCHWFSGAACKMHAMRRCFIIPLYLASLGVMVLLIVPVIVYYQDYKISLNGTATNFSSYCTLEVVERTRNINVTVFPELVLDVTQTLCFLDMSNIRDIRILTGSAVSWWLGLVLATLYIWFLSLYRIERTQDLFMRRLYEGAFIEQSLLLNTRFDIQISVRPKPFKPLDPVKVFFCATMWHETHDEMMKMIISIFRLDKFRPKNEDKHNDVAFEGHIFFDDAFRDVPGSAGRHVNEFAEMLMGIVQEVYSLFLNLDKDIFDKQQRLPDQMLVRTPYGGRLVVIMPHGNSLDIHFKDKQVIRHKKRWSQVMYLYYLLGWKLTTKYYRKWSEGEEESTLFVELQKEKQNTYLLALDGDTDFQPAAVMLLVDRLKLYSRVGAACGRIHPTGSGPLVWYQKFEYAVGHWLHKTAEHVFGCVLCSPGCFSLYRAAALMDDNVMKRYTVTATQPRHFIQYDQGEDRWLCTLLMKQGWRVEYNAASDAYTNAPQEFKEFYNQRRRWEPSTIANIIDLLGNSHLITKRNPSMSKPYMLYQLFNLASSLLSPSTVVLMMAGSSTVLFDIHPNSAMVMAVIPAAIYIGVCFKNKANTQLKVAGIMSTVYAFFMVTVVIVILGNMVVDQSVMTPSALFVVILTCLYLVTALMHPQEWSLVVYGLFYILCIPSTYLLLSIYSVVNMNIVSWGTREVAPPAGAAPPLGQPSDPGPDLQQTTVERIKAKLKEFLRANKWCRRDWWLCHGEEDAGVLESIAEEPELQPQETIVIDEMLIEEQLRLEEPHFNLAFREEEPYEVPNQCWISQLQSLSEDMNLWEGSLEQDEEHFFRELISKYLEPLPEDKEQQKKMAEDLKSLRNQMTFVYVMINAMWLSMTFAMQMMGSVMLVSVPLLDHRLNATGRSFHIDPLGFMFILSFALRVVIQFSAMLWHRVCTLVHYVAYLGTMESRSNTQGVTVTEEQSTHDQEEGSSDSESDYVDMEELSWTDEEETTSRNSFR